MATKAKLKQMGHVEAIKKFSETANVFCDLIDSRSKMNRIRFLQSLYLEIPNLISTVSVLPHDFDFKVIKRHKGEEQKEWKRLFDDLKKKFGK